MITEKLGERPGLTAPLGPHQLRHTFATAAVDPAGCGLARPPVPLAALQRLMGHARVETTAVYKRFSDEDLARFLEETAKECRSAQLRDDECYESDSWTFSQHVRLLSDRNDKRRTKID